ncbi:PEP-CTERM sorting domain-containing protein [Luteolibacter sp. Populi]|uniref:PEP-CTERM sorting domain-containing protein n=1 Tax=Luteolibacter sp. Populi TaxID=3230487 RepID=UPI00346561AD
MKGDVGRVTITGKFTTVPEPSAALLGALGSFVILRRRREPSYLFPPIKVS